MRTWLLCGLLGCYVALDVPAIRAWQSEPTLWAHAYAVAPRAPRTARNHATHLFAAGREAEAVAILRVAGPR